MSHHPIADLALLSDCHSAVLVDKSGSVDWWCLPGFASPSVFGRLLDQEQATSASACRGQRGWSAATSRTPWSCGPPSTRPQVSWS